MDANAEEGSAVVEFVVMGVLLLIPVVYLVLAAGQLQAGSFAAVGAAEQAAHSFASSPDPDAAHSAARQAADLVLQDFGLPPERLELAILCLPDPCLTPGTAVTATASVRVPLPLIPALPGVDWTAAVVESTSTHLTGRFQ